MKDNLSSLIAKFEEVIDDVNISDLLRLKAYVEMELIKRGVSFDVGEIGERLCIEHFNSTPGLPKLIAAPAGAKNVDALSRQGDRYSIKTSMRAKKTSTIYPDTDQDKQLFEYIVLVRLGNFYELLSIYRFSWAEFIRVRAWDKRMNAWYIPLSHRIIKTAELIIGQRIGKA
jgi:hypothetical protein